MNYNKVSARINEAEKQEAKLNEETEAKISDLKDQLSDISNKLEETYKNGDFETGEKLTEQKSIIESKISYLKSFLEKRKNIQVLSEEEEKDISNYLLDELKKAFLIDIEKADKMLNGFESMTKEGLNNINIVSDLMGRLIKLQKKTGSVFFTVDGRIQNFYNTFNQIVYRYRNFDKNRFKTIEH